MKLKVGDIIGRKYKMIKRIGSGSFGTIYLVEHIVTKKHYAMKTEQVGS